MANFTIRVTKSNLLEALKANLKKHTEEFKVSMDGYTNLCIKELRRRAGKIKADKAGVPNTWLHFSMSCPSSHEDDYERLIGMLELAEDEEFEITASQYRQWVQDEWEWKSQHVMSNALYAPHS